MNLFSWTERSNFAKRNWNLDATQDRTGVLGFKVPCLNRLDYGAGRLLLRPLLARSFSAVLERKIEGRRGAAVGLSPMMTTNGLEMLKSKLRSLFDFYEVKSVATSTADFLERLRGLWDDVANFISGYCFDVELTGDGDELIGPLLCHLNDPEILERLARVEEDLFALDGEEGNECKEDEGEEEEEGDEVYPHLI